MRDDLLLSICVPVFNRARELGILLRSIPTGLSIEVVICDDGSSDDIADVVDFYSEKLDINYFRQVNSGRALALCRAINEAKGEFVLIMDSDDYFVDGGLQTVVEELNQHSLSDAFVFGVEIVSGGQKKTVLPPAVESNFVAIRADHRVRGDLKEVVRSDIIKDCNQEPPFGVRRVPTSLMWARVAKTTNCLGVSKAVAVKEYLPGGMTDNVFYLKAQYPQPLVELNLMLAECSNYRSLYFRVRSWILWARYSFHAHSLDADSVLKCVALICGFPLYLSDLIKLARGQ